jgi:hypothetical protein
LKPTGKRAIISIVSRREEELQRLKRGLLQRTATATFWPEATYLDRVQYVRQGIRYGAYIII